MICFFGGGLEILVAKNDVLDIRLMMAGLMMAGLMGAVRQ